jgi:hypothetical protein
MYQTGVGADSRVERERLADAQKIRMPVRLDGPVSSLLVRHMHLAAQGFEARTLNSRGIIHAVTACHDHSRRLCRGR